MGISFGSINTGLPKDIVEQLIAAEKIPIQRLEVKRDKIESKHGLVKDLVALVGGIRGELTKSGTSRSLRELKFETRNDIIGVTLDKNIANPANYRLEVLELAQKSSAMSSGFSDKDNSYVGVGYIQYSLPDGKDYEVYVDSSNSSLTGIAKLINGDTENGMSATVINDGSGSNNPWRIIISMEDTGTGKNASFPEFYFLDGEDDFYLDIQNDAKNAKIKLDGFEIEVPDNKISELIPGVTFDLRRALPGEEFSLAVTEDVEAITGKISDLIKSINNVFVFIKGQNQLDASSDTSRTLGGDSVLQSLESRLRSAVFKDVKTSFGSRRVANLGVSFQRDGLLKFDQDKFDKVVAEKFQMAGEILRGVYTVEGGKIDGFMDFLDKTINTILRRPDGLLLSRKKTFESKIDQINRKIVNRQKLIERKEKTLKAKFARLEGTISKMKNQGAGLAALGAAGMNPVQQLG